MSFAIYIPARLASRRLPDKPLRKVAGKPLIQWTYEQAYQSDARDVVVLCDCQELIDACLEFTADVELVSEGHCGTERIANFFDEHGIGDDRIVNLQCDEPLIEVEDLNRLGQSTFDGISTLVGTPLFGCDGDRNATKVVTDLESSRCYWFSRYYMGPGTYQHVGAYSFPSRFFERPHNMSRIAEGAGLEQLTWLEEGWQVEAVFADRTPPSVNTEADLLLVEGILCRQSILPER